MVSVKRNQQGITLVEVIFVLAIAALILYLSLQQYLTYKRASELNQLKNNVNILFHAAAQYYRVHCADPNPYYADVSQPNPLNTFMLGQMYGISYQTLIDEGFLTQALRFTPVVDETNNPYIIQLNQVQETSTDLPLRIQKMSAGADKPLGKIIVWKIQIAARLSNVVSSGAVINTLGANCMSYEGSDWSGTPVVLPCSSFVPGAYAVWERLPSLSSDVAGANSTFSSTMHTVRQFNQMYTTYPINVLVAPVSANQQYFVCGG